MSENDKPFVQDDSLAKLTPEQQLFLNVSRHLTPEEQARVERIDLSEEDVANVVAMFRNGLATAAMAHEAAVQSANFVMSCEVSVRLSRPVVNKEGSAVEEVVGRDTLIANICGQKIYKEGTPERTKLDAEAGK